MNGADRSGNRPRRAFPLLTLSFVILAVFLIIWPEASAQAVYQRTAILHGQIWRLYSGHFVHFGASHFGWNIVLVFLAGVWLESRWTKIARIFMLSVPVVISLALLALNPQLEVYAGLSGVVTSLIALLGLLLWRSKGNDQWLGMTMVGLVVVKGLAELLLSMPLFAQFPDEDIRVEPLAHVVGMMAALFYFVVLCDRECRILPKNPKIEP